MTNKKMLIDATHPEETRVVVLSGKRLEDFDVEVASKRQLKGNIYLAKVTRVEPSLQAAFVEYGGNRHGFLAFSEIHPDYYQIPVADREALLAEQEAAERADEERRAAADEAHEGKGDGENGDGENGGAVAEVGGDDMEDVELRRPVPPHKRYKIQEVIKRRQIMLVQVVKEERGNKGAALTTYLSLAGRYCVLMPNTARGGGISRKIATSKDRKRLKDMLKDLQIPEGMAVIVRTAGAERTKPEIKRDYEYLLRQWNKVRETTLASTAPAKVYEEGDIIKRAIRDLYNSDIDEIIVDGDEAYRQAKDFMKLLIPSHAKKVQPYKDEGMPLLRRYQVESQMDAMHGHEVQLKSGGYIVINPTEALVSIDVNSGKATRERNIEETALKTNLEAADEVARQLRLRDLAGLIVIDFIDMERSRNQTQVERRLKEAMKQDRARIQIGRISPFGLMEMSRQRLRPSLHETSFDPCPYCAGSGVRRSTDSTALYVLRAIEDQGLKRRGGVVTVHVPTSVALYILNNKRPSIADLEARYGFQIVMEGDDSLIPPNLRIDHIAGEAASVASQGATATASVEDLDEADDGRTEDGRAEDGTKRKRRRRRRGRRGSEDETGVEAAETLDADEGDDEGRDEDEDRSELDDEGDEGAGDAAAPTAPGVTADDDEDGAERKKRRRRGRRGGRRRRKPGEGEGEGEAVDAATGATEEGGVAGEDRQDAASEAAAPTGEADDAAEPEGAEEKDAAADEKPKRRRRTRRPMPKADADAEATDSAEEAAPPVDASPEEGAVAEAGPEPETAAVAGEAPEAPEAVAAAEAPIVIAVEKSLDDTLAEEARKAEAAKTTVIDLTIAKPADMPAKRGWWRR